LEKKITTLQSRTPRGETTVETCAGERITLRKLGMKIYTGFMCVRRGPNNGLVFMR
jgi:hypothetical protein